MLWFENRGVLQKVYYHSVKEEYRSQADYEQELGQSAFNMAARYLDQPLTRAVLQKLNLTPFAEEVLMQLEAGTAHSGLQPEESPVRLPQLRALPASCQFIRHFRG